MKKIFKIGVFIALLVATSSFAEAQSKVGYINFQALLAQMPEAKTIKTQVDDYSKQFIDQLTTMNNELQTKGAEFTRTSASMTDAVRTAKQTELQDLQKRIQDYNNTAQQQVDAKTNELVKPLSDKARAAVSAVAKEKGYTYVFDTGQAELFLVAPDADNLMDAVKAKLGLK